MWIHGIYRHILAEIAKIEQFFMLKILDEKITGRIKIIFARLVNHSDVIRLLRPVVGNDRINLANHQIFAVFILETDGIPNRMWFFHGLSPEIV